MEIRLSMPILAWDTHSCIVFLYISDNNNKNKLIFQASNVHREKYKKDPIFRYIVYSVILKNYKKRKKVHVGDS